jgi:hypothetical protein
MHLKNKESGEMPNWGGGGGGGWVGKIIQILLSITNFNQQRSTPTAVILEIGILAIAFLKIAILDIAVLADL